MEWKGVVDFGGHGVEGFPTEYGFDWEFKNLADLEGEVETRRVISAFDGADGLGVDVDEIGKCGA